MHVYKYNQPLHVVVNNNEPKLLIFAYSEDTSLPFRRLPIWVPADKKHQFIKEASNAIHIINISTIIITVKDQTIQYFKVSVHKTTCH